ncbi:30S ribosomal protein S9 [Actinopolymorpha rutila]|uniref:Small ribosomal subunit protein uS9 n=1 Tax=Actinopolymorpha rutila TaxID=446787 RepID=A0A852ZHT6_9ACTN|nr:small subunit ribosomal protein S9 [Actinopolymorpha rutila]
MAESTTTVEAEGATVEGAAGQTEGDATVAYSSESAPEAASAAPRPAAIGPAAATGRRKEAVARVRVFPGSGQWRINGKTLDQYFPNKVHQQHVNEPFVLLDLDGQYDVIANLDGGGVTGQAGALRLGISRALNEVDAEANRPPLKRAGMLTRDPRAKERRKAGLKKARKAPQYSKR